MRLSSQPTTRMNRELVSVVVPVYNVEPYLEECLDSICSQSYQNLEILLVNDGSTDNSAAICQRFASADKRIRYISQENQGLSGARNTGIAASTGSLITFVDSDDIIHHQLVQKMRDELIRKDADIVHCRHARVNHTCREVIQTLPVFKDELHKPILFFCAALEGKFSNGAWAKLYKTQLFKNHRIEYPLGRHHEDIHVTMHLYFLANRIGYVNDILYFWRLREDSITGQRIKSSHIEGIYQGLHETKDLLVRNGSYNLFLPSFHARVSTLTDRIIKKLQNTAKAGALPRNEVHGLAGFIKGQVESLMEPSPVLQSSNWDGRVQS